MAGPLVLVSTAIIKEGKLEEYKAFTRQMVERIKAKEPRLLAFGTYANEAGTRLTGIQVHPDSESLLFHLGQMDADMNRAFEMITTESLTICGDLNEELKAKVAEWGKSGVTLNVSSQPLSGFARLAPG